MTALLDGFRNCWLGANNRATADWLERSTPIEAEPKPMASGWVAAECAAVLHRLIELRGEGVAELPDPRPLLDKLGTRTLTVLAEPLPPWERSLKHWSNLPTTPRTKTRGTGRRRRP